jgi:hypothetical protein
MKISNDTIGNRTRDLPACSATPQRTAPPGASLSAVQAIFFFFSSETNWKTVNVCHSILAFSSQHSVPHLSFILYLLNQNQIKLSVRLHGCLLRNFTALQWIKCTMQCARREQEMSTNLLVRHESESLGCVRLYF